MGKINAILIDNDGIPKEGSHCICLSVILIDSALGKNYYVQVSLEECKYIIKEKR